MTQTTSAAAVPSVETATCRLCGSHDFVHIATAPDWLMPEKGLFHVYRCTNCELGETRPQLSPAQLGEHYPQSYSPYNKPAPRSRAKSGLLGQIQRFYAHALYKTVQNPSLSNQIVSGILGVWPLTKWIGISLPYRDKPGKVLDIGCAQGHFLRESHSEGWQAYGLEMTEGLADALVQEGIADIRYGRFEDVAYDSGLKFDAITMWHVLEHFEDPVPVMKRCNELIADDGFIAIGIPMYSPLEVRIFGKYFLWELPRHQSHFTPKAVERLFNDAGFEITIFSYEVNINNWIHSVNNRRREKGQPLLNIYDKFIQRALKPLALFLKFSRLAGRVIIYGRKKRAV